VRRSRGGFNDRVLTLEGALMFGMLVIMTSRDAEFELKPGRIGKDRSSLSEMRANVRRASGFVRSAKTRMEPKTGLRAHFRKGSAGKARPLSPSQRRVVVKARFAVHGASKGAPLKAHVSYLAREGAAQKRPEPGLQRSVDYLQREETLGTARLAFYDGREEGIDAKAVTAGWADDSRHFRLIVSAEDGEALGDLKPMIREVMAGLEQKLGTRLEWLAVDHWDTDNPHSHVLLRGVRAEGDDLFIPSKILSHGIREHAQEIVTRVLGPRLEVDLARERHRDIVEIGPTSLDRELVASQDANGVISIRRPDLIARLERLEGWELAAKDGSSWRIVDGLIASLKTMQQHAEVEQAVSAHLSEGKLVLAAEPGQAIEGQLVHLAPADEFGDGFLAVIETGRNELRYQRFDREEDMARLRDTVRGAIVAFEANVPEVRPSDRAIAAVAGETGGLYSMEHHLGTAPGAARGLIEANIRRLEAMRRMSLVSRTGDGVFIVGPDHLKRALIYEERLVRKNPLSARVLSYWTLAEQVEAIGPTKLDRVLTGEVVRPMGEGAFARQHASALQQRRLFLIEQGWLGKEERVLSALALDRLASTEMRAMAQWLSKELGKPVLGYAANHIEGVYARRIDLAQGRMALIVGERRAHLVPWRPALERFAGREVEGLMRGQTLSWGLARGMAPGLPPMV
jgi:hypothetical protein